MIDHNIYTSLDQVKIKSHIYNGALIKSSVMWITMYDYIYAELNSWTILLNLVDWYKA